MTDRPIDPLVGWARGWVAGRGWAAEEDAGDEDTIFALGPEVGGPRWRWYLQVHVGTRQVTLVAVLDPLAPEDRRAAVAEAVLRASFGMNVGTFELDVDDGEVRFRTGVGLGAGGVDEPLLHALLDEASATCGAMADGYLPAFDAVLAGEPPVLAIRAVEG